MVEPEIAASVSKAMYICLCPAIIRPNLQTMQFIGEGPRLGPMLGFGYRPKPDFWKF